MKRAAIIGLAASGESTMLRGIGKYSEVRSELGKHITNSRFSEVFLCEPTRRYRIHDNLKTEVAAPKKKTK